MTPAPPQLPEGSVLRRSPTTRAARPWRWLLVPLVVLVAVAGVTGWMIQRDRAPVGVVAGVSLVDPAGSTPAKEPSVLLLPGVRLSVAVTPATEGRRGDERVRPPRGGRLVRASWSTSASGDVRAGAPEPTRELARGGRVTLTVVSGGSAVVLDRDAAAPGRRGQPSPSAVLALPGDARDLRLVARFAGREQWVEPFSGRRGAGAFAPLYLDSTESRRTGPRTVRSARLAWQSESWVAWSRTPWHPTYGWAAQGREWLVLDPVSVGLTRFAKGSGDGETLYGRVPGSPAVATLSAPGVQLMGAQPQLSGGGDLTVSGSPIVLSVPSGQPVDLRLTMTWTVGPRGDTEGAVRLQQVEQLDVWAPGNRAL